jgi:hypothetical protein
MMHSFRRGLGFAAAATATGTTLPEILEIPETSGILEIIRFVPVGACMMAVFDKFSVFS